MNASSRPEPVVHADDLRARARQLLRLDLPDDVFTPQRPAPLGDVAVNAPEHPASLKGKPAAVLVPVVAREQGPTLLFTQRSSRLRNHSGQISFPGGRMDPEDATPLDAALRETREEVGVGADCIEPLGYLDTYLSGTGYRIVPLVALLHPPFDFVLNPHEVEHVFEVPLEFLVVETNHKRHRWERDGVQREGWAMPYEDKFIWGVTAAILRNFWERLYREAGGQ